MLNQNDYKVVCFGEILWDMLPAGAVPGGAPMNVAYHLHKLGMKPTLVTRVGRDERGKRLLGILKAANLNTDYVQSDFKAPTGIVNATPNSAGEMKYEIVSPAAWDHISLDEDTRSIIKESSHLVFGSLVTRNKTSRDTLFELLEIAQARILDINLRPPHFNKELVQALLNRADILKMNLEELELITGWFADYKTVEQRVLLLQDKFKIPTIIVTMGAAGAVINMDGRFYRHPGYKVNVADTVGSGDSFLAGFLSKIFNHSQPDEALAFASALGAFIASKTGAWPSYDPSQIADFLTTHPPQQIFFNNN